jgi:hypothetical protein
VSVWYLLKEKKRKIGRGCKQQKYIFSKLAVVVKILYNILARLVVWIKI